MNRTRRYQPVIAIAALLAILSLSATAQDGQALPAVPACLLTEAETLTLNLELADTPDQKRIGLMGRTVMAADHGMLFRYQNRRSADAGFWMYQTLMPLDIAWLDENGTIVALDTMVPCPETRAQRCPVYTPGVPHYQVLELNSGYFSANSVTVGDKLALVTSDQNPCQ